MRHIIDLCDLTKKEFDELYKLITNIIDRPEGYVDACRGKVLGSLFYEPSTRTNLSFSTAMMRLGGSVVGFSDPRSSSTTKGETLKDTINMVSCYADMIVMRSQGGKPVFFRSGHQCGRWRPSPSDPDAGRHGHDPAHARFGG